MNFNLLEVMDKGKQKLVRSVKVGNDFYVVSGKFIKTARIHKEWMNDVSDIEHVIRALKEYDVDLFTFWQRLPDTVPKYNYFMEWHPITALPITTYDHWIANQIKTDTRKKIKRAPKRGVDIRLVDVSDDFTTGVMHIFNETPIRRGKSFWHYGKDFNSTKSTLLLDLDTSDFIAAYLDDELIGFIKLNYFGRYANPGLILSLLKYQNQKYTNNALIAKAVEVCAEKKMEYLTYTDWRLGSHADFLRRHGFQKVLLPRYFVPLTAKGNLYIKLGLHRGIRSFLPEKVLLLLLECRKKFYKKIYA